MKEKYTCYTHDCKVQIKSLRGYLARLLAWHSILHACGLRAHALERHLGRQRTWHAPHASLSLPPSMS